jgi:hypothetical protein
MRLWPVALVAAFTASTAFAQTGPELLLRPMADELRFDGRVSATYFFSSDFDIDDIDKDTTGEAQVARYFAEGRVRFFPGDRESTPIRKADPRVGFSLTELTVEDDGGVLPGHFTDMQFGVGSGVAQFGDWIAGITLGIGYAGANSFGESDAIFGAATLLFGRQLDENTSLGVALDYNGNRTFMPDTPLPGLVYTSKLPERNLEFSLGFPNAYGRWKPTEALLLEINFTFPDFVGGRVSYDFVDGVGLFASFARRTDAWTADDLDDHDRIFFEQTLAELGARFNVDDRFAIVLAGGWAFGQEFSVGYDTRDDDKLVELDDGPFVRLEGEFRF